jgi:hypothetical protein
VNKEVFMIEFRMQVLKSQHSGLYRASRNAVAAASVVAIVAVTLMIGGCATGGGSQSAVIRSVDVIGQASAYTTLKAPPADKALVCFLRPSGFVGMVVPWFFFETGKISWTLRNGTYYHALMDPGKHIFALQPGPGVAPVFMTVELQGGKIYCFLGSLSGQMTLQTPEEANALIPKLKFWKQDGD